MTASVSIAIPAKPHTRRTAKIKGFHLSGAKSQRFRHDKNCRPHVDQTESQAPKPSFSAYDDIVESLRSDLSAFPVAKSRAAAPNRLAYTTESTGFTCIPGSRPRTRNVVATKRTVPVIPEPPQFDAAGRPIVYVNSYDAWSLRVRR